MEIAEAIRQYKELLDSGAITPEEFYELKKKALGGQPSTMAEETQKPSKPSQKTEAVSESPASLIGSGILTFTTAFLFVSGIIGLFFSWRAQYVMDFVAGMIALVYIPFGIFNASRKKERKTTIVTCLLSFAALLIFTWGVIVFCLALRYW